MKALSHTPYALAATIVVLQWMGMPVAHAGDRIKPYLATDRSARDLPALDPTAPDLTAAGTERLEKLLLHAALADSSAFGLLQALQQPAKPMPTLLPTTAAGKPVSVECHEGSRRKT